jgi:hypothetical protein
MVWAPSTVFTSPKTIVASLTKDPEKAAELIRTADEYLRRADRWLADRIKDP